MASSSLTKVKAGRCDEAPVCERDAFCMSPNVSTKLTAEDQQFAARIAVFRRLKDAVAHILAPERQAIQPRLLLVDQIIRPGKFLQRGNIVDHEGASRIGDSVLR